MTTSGESTGTDRNERLALIRKKASSGIRRLNKNSTALARVAINTKEEEQRFKEEIKRKKMTKFIKEILEDKDALSYSYNVVYDDYFLKDYVENDEKLDSKILDIMNKQGNFKHLISEDREYDVKDMEKAEFYFAYLTCYMIENSDMENTDKNDKINELIKAYKPNLNNKENKRKISDIVQGLSRKANRIIIRGCEEKSSPDPYSWGPKLGQKIERHDY